MNSHKYLKPIFILFTFCTLTLVCNAQNLLDGKWYLQEVQIPSNEKYSDENRYDLYECIILESKYTEFGEIDWVYTEEEDMSLYELQVYDFLGLFDEVAAEAPPP